MSKTKDLTQGNPASVLLAFAVPVLIGNLLQQLYSTVDSIVVGNFVGAYALGAVGTTFPITFMITAVAFGLSNGAAVLVGQSFGKGENEKIKRIITICCGYGVVVSLLLSVVFYLITPTLLNIINASPEIYDDALIYANVYYLGLIFTFSYNMISSIFRALGDSKTPLIFLAISSILNIVLDLVFVLSFDMGVFGVAIATVISQGVSFVLQVIFLKIKLKHFEQLEKSGTPLPDDYNKQVVKSLMKIALPSTLQEMTIGINIFITQALVNMFGPNASSAYTACGKIENFAMMPMINMSIAMTAFTAQNMGAKKPERVKVALKYAVIFSIVVAAIISVLIVIIPNGMMSIFIGRTAPAEVYTIGKGYLLAMSINLMFMSILFTSSGVLRGSGDVKCMIYFAFACTVTKIVISVLLVMVFNVGIVGIWIGSVCSWGVEAILTRMRYNSGKWQHARIN